MRVPQEAMSKQQRITSLMVMPLMMIGGQRERVSAGRRALS